ACPRRRGSYGRDGAVRGPPHGTGLSARLCPAVSHRRVSGVYDGRADPLWALGAATAPAGARPSTHAALDATAWAALCASGEDGAAPASGPREPPRGVWLPGGRQSHPGPPGLAHQHGIRGADQPRYPSACRRGRATGQHALQGRGWVAPTAGLVSHVLQFLLAPCLLASAAAAAGSDQWHGLRQAVAALYTSDGGRIDRAC